jgi:outer membrane receptor protein involved in Fe transport
VTVLGLATGNVGLITRGSYYVNEGYGELSIPIVSNVPGAVSLEATAAARVFNYSNFGSDITYKFGGLWKVIQDISLRGTYSTAFRAPNINDLFLGQQDNFAPVKDPCRGPGVSGGGPVPANCTAQGIPATGTGDDQSQLRSRVGGNPALKPETAKIFTAGVVLQPTMVKGLTATVDYYNITIDNNISSIGEAQILAGCYPQAGGTPKYCNLVVRDPTTQKIQSIFNLNANVGQDKTDGIDISVRYFLPTEFGRFGFSWDGTWLRQYNRLLASGDLEKARGTYDLGVYPAWKFISGATYSLGGFTGGVVVHFTGGFHECGDDSGDFSGSGLCYKDPQIPKYVRQVLPYSTWDIYLAYALQTSVGKTTFGAGMNNVFDRSPSKIYNGFLAASDPSAYDYLGRFGYVRVSQAF